MSGKVNPGWGAGSLKRQVQDFQLTSPQKTSGGGGVKPPTPWILHCLDILPFLASPIKWSGHSSHTSSIRWEFSKF